MEVHRRIWGLLGLDPEARKKATDLMQSSTPAGAEMREKVRHALEATEDEVQALGIQMNQRYISSRAVVVEPGDFLPDLSSVNALRQVWITTFPGYHLPHVWLAQDAQSHKISTLDLSGHGGFTLLTGIGGQAWVNAAQAISASKKIPVKGFTIGFRCDYMDCYRDWAKVRGVSETGVVLVRPDHFVGWRCNELVQDPVAKLTSVLEQILDSRHD